MSDNLRAGQNPRDPIQSTSHIVKKLSPREVTCLGYAQTELGLESRTHLMRCFIIFHKVRGVGKPIWLKKEEFLLIFPLY